MNRQSRRLKTLCLKILFVALPLVSLMGAFSPARAGQPLAVSGPYTLTQASTEYEVAIWQMVAGQPMSAADRRGVQNVMVSLFRHDPAWLLANAKQARAALPRLSGQNAVERAGLREANLVDIYCTPQALHMTADEAAQMQAVMSRYAAIVNVDQASGTVMTERDIDAWLAAAREVAAQTHTQPAATRAVMLRALQDPKFSKANRVKAADMEQNWAAYHLGWSHEPAADRRTTASEMTRYVQHYAAQKQTGDAQAGAALMLASSAFSDYPYSLDTHFAVSKPKIMAQVMLRNQMLLRIMMRGQANSNMIMDQGIRENSRIMRNGVRAMNGQDPLFGDESPAPFHFPVTP